MQHLNVNCIFCQNRIQEDFINHVLFDCNYLVSKRKRYNIKGKTDYILSGKDCNIYNLLKVLAAIYKESKFIYYN